MNVTEGEALGPTEGDRGGNGDARVVAAHHYAPNPATKPSHAEEVSIKKGLRIQTSDLLATNEEKML